MLCADLVGMLFSSVMDASFCCTVSRVFCRTKNNKSS